ncbi:MAG: hypothetical protein DME82_12300, partial [Verrucomicrobia bacterium]
AHDAKDAVAFFQITGRIEMPRPGKIDIDDFLDRGGTIAHDENAIGELDGFLDIVRDQEDYFLFALPDTDEIGAHFSRVRLPAPYNYTGCLQSHWTLVGTSYLEFVFP